MVVQSLLNVLTHPATSALFALATGWFGRSYYVNWRYGAPKGQTDLVRDSLMHKIAAERAIKRLTLDQKRGLEAEVDAEMKEHFGDEAAFEIRALDDERDSE
jgi:hypothetical protein